MHTSMVEIHLTTITVHNTSGQSCVLLRATACGTLQKPEGRGKQLLMATDHAASVFTHSLLSTPRDPVTRLPADRLAQSTGRPRSQETGGTSHKLTPSSIAPSRPSTSGGVESSKWTGAEGSRDDSFQVSLGPDTPYIRSVTIRSGKTRQPSQFSSPEISRKKEHLDPSTVVGNERGQPPSTAATRNDDYATLFATLLESNMLLREEIQRLKADNQRTMMAVEQLQEQTHNEPVLLKNGHQPDSSAAPGDTNSDESALSLDSDEQGLPPNLLQNTWMESSTDQGENQRPSCLASSQSLPASADDQHEYDLVDGGHEDLDSEGGSNLMDGGREDLNSEGESSIEVDPLEIDSESVHTCSSDSSRPSSPSAVHEEICAHSSRSTESLLSSSSSGSLTSSASSSERMQARRANEGDPFASPGMLAVERMWSDFSIEDYAPRGSYGNEQEKGGKRRDKKKEWTPKITVPKPFLMTVRESQSPKRKSRSMIQAEQERLEREALEEAELRKQFRATPLPANTYLPLYELINAKNEQRREEVKMLSKQILKDSERPFSFTKRDNERRLVREEEMRRSLELEKTKLKEATFSAKPIPRHLFDPDVAERLKEQEDYREIRIRLRAQELMAKSKLPGNMQLKGREYSLGALRKKRLEENQDKAFMTDEHIFHPTVSSGVPDYDQAYLEFQKQLALKKRTKHTTATEPFYLRTQLIPSRKEQVLQDIQREEELRLRNRWPLAAPSAKVSSRSPKHARTKSSGVPYPSQLTKTAKVRFSLSREKMTHALAKERALENKERERRERQEALKKTVSQKSQSCDPKPWLEERKQKKYHQFK